jgi:hypothetical protein
MCSANYFAILNDLEDKFVSQFIVTRKFVHPKHINLWKLDIQDVVMKHWNENELRELWITFRGYDNLKCCLQYYKLDEILCKLFYHDYFYESKQCESVEQVYNFINLFIMDRKSKNVKTAIECVIRLLEQSNATNIQTQNGFIRFDFPSQVFNIFESGSKHQFLRTLKEFTITQQDLENVSVQCVGSHQYFIGNPHNYGDIKSTFTLFQGFDSESYKFWVVIALRCNFLQYYGITNVHEKQFILEYDHHKFWIYIKWLQDYTFELKMSIDSQYGNTLDQVISNPGWNDLKYSQLVQVGKKLLQCDENYYENYSSGSDY